jgi:hypothetical protein
MPIPRILEIMATCLFDCWSCAWEKQILYHLPLTVASDSGDDILLVGFPPVIAQL